ncbi:P-loop containing nucleoside triphosphate hydrolase protein [Corynascus novoguineensis]|uniref:P-loop containing nucleoside triphosphate hydrolase protein n=1 Tax=Corynascus novoguineensis TaxID=1126955 RepID=A0AAN7D0I2_9PEZI|nr:P-loop containing nucleoside triphosphate hydrolase protein [Corynascus novoguineensis]
MDIEQQRPAAEKRFLDTPVEFLSWSRLTVIVKDGKTGRLKTLVDDAGGIVRAGECCAVMGPSGCGKTTFLNALAQRPVRKAYHVSGQVTLMVQDHDTFIGALTVRKTLQSASHLARVSSHRQGDEGRVDALLEAFGLAGLAASRVGAGISHGQKRRLAVAKQLVTGPSVLFLDEPTSGLDSMASYHVVSYLRQLARRMGLVVTHYFGAVGSPLIDYYAGIGVTVPERANPADFLLELVSTDFAQHHNGASVEDEHERVSELAAQAVASGATRAPPAGEAAGKLDLGTINASGSSKPTFFTQLVVLTHRSFIKAYRDGLAYTLRLAMYAALGLLAGTVWLSLGRRDQDSIQLLINALLVSCGFMSFMAVTYVPAFVEDDRQFRLDRRNGLCGPAPFLLSNLIVGTPFLCFFSAAFSVLFYWLADCRRSAAAFFAWTAWLYLNLLAAEGVVTVCVALVPGFVSALVGTSLLNVLAFSTASTLCQIAGETVLDLYGVRSADQGRNVGIAVAIVLGYRLVAWLLLKMKH